MTLKDCYKFVKNICSTKTLKNILFQYSFWNNSFDAGFFENSRILIT